MIRISFLRYSYVDSTHINTIKSLVVGKSSFQWLKAQLKVGQYLISSGYKQLKQDLSFYYTNFSTKLTGKDYQRMILTRNNLLKLPPIGILFCFPGGIPFILIYMLAFPALTPTWFLEDSYSQKIEKKKKQKQISALKYFIKCGGVQVNQIQNLNKFNTALTFESLQNMNLQQQKKLQQLCYGEAFDGTNLIRNSIKINFNYFLTPSLSSYLIVRSMSQKLNGQQQIDQVDQNTDILKQKILRETKLLYEQIQ